eukprot:26152-Pleurochrysis_carterae.AAC.2
MSARSASVCTKRIAAARRWLCQAHPNERWTKQSEVLAVTMCWTGAGAEQTKFNKPKTKGGGNRCGLGWGEGSQIGY